MLRFKLLVPGIVWMLLLLSVNLAYADENSILDTFKQGTSDRLPVNDSTVTTDLHNSDVKLKASDKTSSNKQQSNSRKKGKRKTHYGIGYEYRKSLLEEIQTSENILNPDKIERHEGVDSPERLNSLELTESPERVERPERIDSPERVERPERIERPERVERPDRVERPEIPGRPDRPGR